MNDELRACDNGGPLDGGDPCPLASWSYGRGIGEIRVQVLANVLQGGFLKPCVMPMDPSVPAPSFYEIRTIRRIGEEAERLPSEPETSLGFPRPWRALEYEHGQQARWQG